jgi:DNA (cytosine-5)-methyltransferase 1
MLRVLDLFSGVGGFSLGLERTGGFETVAFCEIEEFPRKVLAKHWPGVPIHQDVRKLKGSDVGAVDVICGGYPCQPFSTAGRRLGAEDDRHLWPEFSRLVDELRPAWVIGENVAGHISMGLDDVLSDLEGKGYACRAFVIPACAVDAPHRRDRVWTVAHGPQLQRNGGEHIGRGDSESARADQDFSELGDSNGGADLAGAERIGQSGPGQPFFASRSAATGEGETDHAFAVRQPGKWCPEPGVGRVAHGVPSRVDRLKALGNAVVPQVVEMIGHAILQAEGRA